MLNVTAVNGQVIQGTLGHQHVQQAVD
jgi:hypothetical protein